MSSSMAEEEAMGARIFFAPAASPRPSASRPSMMSAALRVRPVGCFSMSASSDARAAW
jgi:hypothetical protein